VLGLLPFTATGLSGVVNIQDILGGSADDTLIGNSDDNILTGNGGSDYLQGGSGDDTYKFGNSYGLNDQIIELANGGGDTLDFSAVTDDLTFLLGSVVVTDGEGNTATHSADNIEHLIGGSGDDTVIFSADGVSLAAGAGSIDGGGGTNTIDYGVYNSNVIVDLAAGLATGTGGIANFQNVIGGEGHDQLTGNTENNILTGNGGDDSYYFADNYGVDTIIEIAGGGLLDAMDFSALTVALTFTLGSVIVTDGAGSKTTHSADFIERLIGGQADDSFVFSLDGVEFAGSTGTIAGGGGSNTLDYSAYDTNQVQVNLAIGTATGTGGIAGIHNVIGGSLVNEIWGDDGPNELVSGSSNDNLHGLGGDDTYVFLDDWMIDNVFEQADGGSDTMAFINVSTGLTFDFGFDAFGAPQVVIGDGVNTVTATGGFIENFVGTGQNDTFIYHNNAAINGVVDGQGGNDTIDYSVYASARDVTLTDLGSVDGFQGFEASGAFDNIDNLIGTVQVDFLMGHDAPAEFVLDAADQYISTNTLDFVSFETLNGGSAADTFRLQADHDGDLVGGPGDDSFVFTGAAVVNGKLDGSAGVDSLDFSAYSARQIALTGLGIVDGFNAVDSTASVAVRDGFYNVDALAGSGGLDTLTGANLAASWRFDGADTYSAGGHTLTHSGYEILVGGADEDTFSFIDAATFDGELDGGLGVDRFDFSGYGSAVTLNLQSALIPGVLNNAFAGIEALLGSGHSDTLIGPDAGASFNMTAAGTGNIDTTFAFTSIENLSGGAGADTLDYSGYPTAVTLDMQTSMATGLDSFIGIETVTGSPASDTIQAAAAGSLFQMTVPAAGMVDGLKFASFEKLVGGAGVNTLDYSAYAAAITINLQDGTATGLTSFTAIENLTGSPNDDHLIGQNADTLFAITGADSGTVAGWNFTSFENLTGGSGVDTFAFQGGALSGSLNGGLGVDRLDYSAHGSAVEVDLLAQTASGIGGAVTNVEDIFGSPFDDILTGNNAANRIDAVGGADLITGHGGDDQFVFPDGTTFRGLLDGGTGTDVADFSTQPVAITTVIADLGTSDGFAGIIDTKAFDNLDILIASNSVGDSLTGRDASAAWNLDASYQYISAGRTFTFSNFETLTGGTGADVFNFIGSIVFNGDIAGGDGADTLNYSAYNGPVTVNLQTQVATGITSTFASIEVLVGSNSSDTLVGTNAADDIQITSANSGTFAGYTFTSFENIDGGVGADTLSFTAYGSVRDVTLTTTGLIDGFNGTDSSLTGGFTNIDNLIGSGQIGDTLRGLNVDVSWIVDGVSNQYQVNPSLGFADFETLVGGNAVDTFNLSGDLTNTTLLGLAGDDEFIFADNATLRSQSPAIDGGLGDDMLDYRAFTTTQVDVDVVAGRAMNINNNTNNGFRSIENVIGGQNNVLYGDDDDNILKGGPGVNILVGRGGNDIYIFEDGWGTAVVIENPGEGSDTIDLARVTDSLTLTFNGEIFSAAAGANTLIHTGSSGVSHVENFIGGQAGDTFNIIGTSNIVNLSGGPGDDTFAFDNNATLDGTITGEDGADTLDYNAYTTSVTVDLFDGSAFNVSGNAAGRISTVENLIGGSGDDQLSGNSEVNIIDGGLGDDTLAGGLNNDTYVFNNNWGVDSVEENDLPGSGDDALDFTAINTDLTFILGSVVVNDGLGNTATHLDNNIEALRGGGGNDAFIFSANGIVLAGGSGIIDGGAGVNTLNYATYSDAVTVNLDAGTATGTNGISNIHNVIGGSGDDTFTSNASDNIFTGNTGDDIYKFLDAWGTDTVLEADAGGDDTMDFSAVSTSLNVTLGSVTVISGSNTATHADNFIENVIGGNAAGNFTINGTQSIDLYAGAGADTFIFANNAVLDGEIDGQGGDDTLNFASYATARNVTLATVGGTDGFNGTEISITGGFSNIDILLGSAASDMLTGANLVNTWTIDGLNNKVASGTYDLAFSSIETVNGGTDRDTFNISNSPEIDLLGGAGADTFTFANNAVLDGDIDGQGGDDTLNLGAYATVRNVTLGTVGSSDGFNGTEASITGSFSNIDILLGSAASDMLTGANLVNTWTIDGLNNKVASGNYDLAFSSIETVNGGTDSDTFNISNNPTIDLFGGAGADSFMFASGAVLDGEIDGQGGDDTINFADYATARNVTLTAKGSTDGFAGTEASITGTFDNIDDLVGGTSDDVLTGLINANATWAVTGADSGQYTTDNDLTFKSFEELVGGDLDDTLTFAAFDTAREISLDAVGANGFDIVEAHFSGIFENINVLIGGSAQDDTFTGLDAVSAWQIDGLTNTYTSTHALTFSTLETLRGGSQPDTFTVADGVTFFGSLDGQGGTDTLTFASYNSGRFVMLTSVDPIDGFNGTETSLTPVSGDGFFNIDIIIGSPMSDDSLTGANLPATWDIDGTDQYIVNPTLDFSDFENLIGGADQDDFILQESVSVTGDVDGGDGVDNLDYSAFSAVEPVMVDLSAGTATNIDGVVSHIENVIGGSGDDQITGDDSPNVITGGPGADTLAGGLGDDRYLFADGWGTDTINEDAGLNTGKDTLDFSLVTFSLSAEIDSEVIISGDGNTASHNGNNIEVVIAGSAADTFTITGARPVSLEGNAGADNFIFTDTASLTNDAYIDGGSEIDVLDYSTNSVPCNWVLTDLGTVDGFKGTETSIPGGFDNINTILGKTRTIDDNGTDSLTGYAVDAIWNINVDDQQYTADGRTLDFTNVENLIGGSQDDSFVFANNASMPGIFNSIAGKSGSDTLDYSAFSAPVEVYLQGGSATGVTGGVSSIENVVGSIHATNTIHGDSGDNILVSGTNDDILIGYGGSDTYVFDTDNPLGLGTDTVDEQTDGGGGTDTLDFSSTSSAFNIVVDLSNNIGATQTVNQNLSLIILGDVEDVNGGSGNDTLTGTDDANVITGGPGDDILNGKAGDDTYLFADDWGTDTLNDDGGAEVLDFSAVTTNLTFDFDTTAVSINDDTNTATHFGIAFETFIGGSGNDLFNIEDGVSVAGYLDGQGGDNTLNLGAYTTPRNVLLTGLGAQSGFDGVDPAIPNGFKNISTVTGSISSGIDRFAGLNKISAWDIDGTNTYTALGRTLQFSGFEKLAGGTAADTFTLSGNQDYTIRSGADDDALVFNDGAILTGSFDGQSDHDTVNMSAYASSIQAVITGLGSTDGFDGTIHGISGIFTNINNLLGSTNSTDDSITGGDFDAFWDIDALSGNQYSALEPLTLTGDETDYDAKRAVIQGRTVLITNESPVTLDFAGFENLQGNDQNDIFEFTAAQTHSVLGGADEDYFVFNDGAALIGTIDGQTGRDTLDYNAGSDGAYASNLNFVLTGFVPTDGFDGQISDLQFSNLDEIIGGAGIDTLNGLDPNSTWMVNDYPTFSRYVSTRELTFAKLDTLIGGSGVDNFDFADKATLAGSIDGNAADDTLNFVAYTSARNFVLTSIGTTDGFDGTVNGIAAGFADINTIIGGSALDTLTGRTNSEGHWAINSANSGVYTSDNDLTFTKVDTLIGGSAADRFDFAQDASIAGLIDGGNGTDLLDYVDFTTSVTVDLSTGLATGVNGNNPNGVSNIENIFGGSTDDSLTGDAGPNEITGNSGDDVLAGMGGDDTFYFAEGWGADTLNEADSVDNDTLDFSVIAVDFDITLGNLFVTDNVSGVCGVDANCLTHTGKGVDTFIAGTGNDTFHINASMDIDIQGNEGADEFIFANNAVINGAVDGGADTDTLNFSVYTSGWDIALTSEGSADGFAGSATGITSDFNNIDIVIAGSGDDTLTGLDTNATWQVTGVDTGQYVNSNTLGFAGFDNLVGGNANDTLTFAAFNTARDISLLDVGNADGFDLTEAYFAGGSPLASGTFKNMNTLVGSTSPDDTLVGLDAPSTWQLIPGDWQYESTNALAFSAIENLVGGSNSDTLNYAAYTTPVDITLINANASGFNGVGTDLSSFSNMDVITGGQSDDTLTGTDQNATWDVDALAGNQYTLNPTLDFTSFEMLIGGSGDDTFNIVGTRAENLQGGSGDDCFIFADGAVLTTTIHGGIGSDTLDYSGYFTDVTVNLATGDLGGGVGTVTDIENITGGHGDDTLTGDDGDNILTGGPGRDLMAGGPGGDIYRFFDGWDNDYPVIENANEGNDTFDFSAVTNPLTFILGSVTVTDGASSAQHTGTHIENLIGGLSDDIFQFNDGATLSGMIDGRTGVDRLDLSAYTSALTTRLTGLGSIDGVAGTIDTVLSSFDNINALTTGSGNDTLIGLDTDATWIINPNPTDNVYASGGISLDFYGVENLTGGSATDTFKLVGTATVTGNVNGGLGAGDTLDYSTYATAVVVDFPAGTATGVGGTVSGVETVVSNGIGVTLEGDEHDNLLIGGPGDDIILGYGGNDTLIGNGGNDLLDGGEGNDTVDYSGSANGVEVDLSAGTATDKTPGTAIGIDTLISIENVIGSDFADTLTGSDVDNILTGGSGDDTLAGLGGDDTYRFGNNADTDIINELAAGGVDTFDFSAATVDLTFSISSVLVTGASINITHTGAHIENLIGGSGDDTFGLGDGASLAGYIDGGNGIDEINFSAYASARFVVLTSVSDLDGFKGTEDSLADGFRNVDKLVGSGANTDALTGLDAASIWTVDGSSSGYSSNGHALSFSDFEILNGGVDADIFNVLNTESGTLSGNAGDDTLHIAEGATLTGSFDGGSGADTISFSGGTPGRDITLTGLGTTDGFAGNAAAGTFDNVNILVGGNGSDSLAGLASGDWQINGANTTYTSGNSLTFSAIERLIGGAGEDTFAFANGATLESGMGTLDGAGGLNTLDYSAYDDTTSVNADLGAGNATATNGISNIHVLVGGQGGDTLTGSDQGDIITGGPGDDILSGGGGDDTYHFANGSGTDTVNEIAGGGTGVDTLNFSAVTVGLTFAIPTTVVTNTGIRVTYNTNTENLVGGQGDDTLSYAGGGVAHTVALSSAGSGDGFAGTASGLAGTFDNMDAFIGGSGVDTLNGLSEDSTWTLDGANSQYANGGRAFGFDSSVETLNGGSGADVFNLIGSENGTLNGGAGADIFHLAEGAALTGKLNGGLGLDTLSFAGNITGRNIKLTGLGTSDGFTGEAAGGTFDNVDILLGGNASDSLTGLSSGVWQINGNDTYTSGNALAFSAIENLIGGPGADTFSVSGSEIFNGVLDGQSGIDTLTFVVSGIERHVTLTGVGDLSGFNGSEASPSSGFANIDILIGSSIIADSLTGANLAATWDIDALVGNQYTINPTLDFSGFETLIGGSDGDTFNISGSQTVDLRGGAGDDTFIFADNANLDGTINGGAHLVVDTLDYSVFSLDVTVNIATGEATSTKGISNIESIMGGSGANTITGDDGDNILFGGPSNDTLIGGQGNDTYIFRDNWGNDTVIEDIDGGIDRIDFSNITAATGQLVFTDGAVNTLIGAGSSVAYQENVESFTGGDFGNQFVFQGGFIVVGDIQGGAGADTLDFSQYDSGLIVTLTGLGTVDGFAGSVSTAPTGLEQVIGGTFDNINTLLGSATGDDILSGLSAVSEWTLDGLNSQVASDGCIISFQDFETINGGSAADTFNFTADENAIVSGGAGNDDFVFAKDATLTGTITGGVDADTLDYSAYTTPVTVNLSTFVAQGVSGDINAIENITGGSQADLLTGDAGPNILKGNPGNDTILGLGGNDTLIGGADNDTLNGGSGDDTFKFEINNWGVDNVNELVGDGVADVMDFSAVTDSLDVVLGSVTVTNGINTATYIGKHIENVIGGSTGDTFTVTGDQNVSLFGGPGDDTFAFANGATLSGTLSGDGGTDELNFALNTNPREVTLIAPGSTDGFDGVSTDIAGSFTNIDILTSGAAAIDKLTGTDAISTWALDDTNQYHSTNTLAFSGFEILQGGGSADTFNLSCKQPYALRGGSGDDNFVFADRSQLIGVIDGQLGSDKLDFSAYTSARHIVLTSLGSQDGLAGGDYSPSTAVTGGFDNINAITGSSDIFADDTIVGMDRVSQWTIGDNCTYKVNPALSFASFETLVGGDANDTFVVSGTRDVTLIGGAGDDTFIIPDGSMTLGSINGQGGSDTIEYDMPILPPYDVIAGTATYVQGGIHGIEQLMLLPEPTPEPVPEPTLEPVILVSLILAVKRSQPIVSEVVIPTYVLPFIVVTRVETDELVHIQDDLINVLVLENVAQVMLSHGNGAMASIILLTERNLPAPLPNRVELVTALTIDLFGEDGEKLGATPDGTWFNMSFALPADYEDYTITLLYWDETLNGGLGGWVEIPIQVLFGDPTLNTNIASEWIYYRYWDAALNNGTGGWVTEVTTATLWDTSFSETLGGWVDLPDLQTEVGQDGELQAILSATVNSTGTFVLVFANSDN